MLSWRNCVILPISRGLSTGVRLVALIAVVVGATALSVGADAPIRYRFAFPEPQHHLMQVEITFPERAARSTAGAHEPFVARPLLDARVREERLRCARHRPGRAAAHRLPAEPESMGRHRPLRHRARAVPRLRRSDRRHVPRGRPHARAHQHARGADVGERHGTSDDDRPVRSAGRYVVECGDADAARHRRVFVSARPICNT